MNKDASEMLGQLMSGLGQDPKKMEWWQSFSYPETVNFYKRDLINFARSALFSKCLQSKAVVYDYSSVLTDSSDVKSTLEELKARLVYDDSACSYFYVIKNGAVVVEQFNKCITIVTTDPKDLAIFKEKIGWKSREKYSTAQLNADEVSS